jgi:hypothetical protein
MSNKQLLCPKCGEPIEELVDTFNGSETYKYSNGIFVKVPNGTIENYAMQHKKCGCTLPLEVVNKIVPMIKE